MCGRFALQLSNLDELRVDLGVEDILIAEWAPRYNIAPTQDAPVLRARSDGRRELNALRWGLVPGWAKDPAVGSRAINARVESVAEKPTFRDAFARRRCLVPASGFYEWRVVSGQRAKQPTLVHAADGSLLTFGGIWEQWRSRQGEILQTFCIVTTEATAGLREIHDRMPLMLRGHDRERWLKDAPLSPQELSTMVQASAGVAHLTLRAVGSQVNTASYDAPDCVEPATAAAADRQLELF